MIGHQLPAGGARLRPPRTPLRRDAFYATLTAAILAGTVGLGVAHADETDNAFFYTLLKEGITVGNRQAALNNVVLICGATGTGTASPDELAAEIDAIEPNLDFDLSKTFVLTAIQFYCIPNAMKKQVT